MHEEGPSFEVDLAVLGYDDTFNSTSRPECMSHRTPRLLWISAEVRLSICADVEPRSSARHSEIDYAGLVRRRLDRIRRGIFAQRHSTAVGIEGKFLVVETVVAQGIRRPEIRGFAVSIEYLRIELTGRMNATEELSNRFLGIRETD